MKRGTLNFEVKLFVDDVSKAVPKKDGHYLINVRLSDGSLNAVEFETAREAAAFLAGSVAFRSEDVIDGFI